jgi:uncharacterized cupin superfamily protein
MKHLPQNLLIAYASLAVVASASTLAAQVPSAPLPKMGSTFYDWDALPVGAADNGSHRFTADFSTRTLNRFSIHATTLNPGASSHPHPQGHANEEAILVKEGTLKVILNGVEHPAPVGSLIFLASHVLHNLTNIGDMPATYYVVDFFTDATASVPDQPADIWESADKLHSTVFDCESLPATPTKVGSRRNVVSSPTATLLQFESHVTTLDVGKETGVLNGLADEAIIIKSGLVLATVDGVSAELGAGSFYFQASGTAHNLKNLGTMPATYQVLKIVTDKTPSGSK